LEENIIEALLFAYGEPISIEKIALAINMDVIEAKIFMRKTLEKYKEQERGVQIIEIENSYQMCTNPKYYPALELTMQKDKKAVQLTTTLLETLAIVAYKQPVTKTQIEDIRGINCIHSINKLIEYGLIKEVGRQNTVGKPLLFATTEEFLKHFGLNSLQALNSI